MIAVIFEVRPYESHHADYFDTADALRPQLEQMDGFLSVERFASVTQPGKILSLSFWRDETAIRDWREHADHRDAQLRGRSKLFATYRIRVAEVIRDYGQSDRTQAPVTE